jgi:hypothetical protein
MLYTLAIILIILWLLGLVTGTAGGLIHILLVLAIMAILLRVISGAGKTNKFNMNKNIIAFILIALGVVVLAYSGITFKTPGEPINFLGMHIETTVSHFISPAVGAIALVGGIILLLLNPKRAG